MAEYFTRGPIYNPSNSPWHEILMAYSLHIAPEGLSVWGCTILVEVLDDFGMTPDNTTMADVAAAEAVCCAAGQSCRLPSYI